MSSGEKQKERKHTQPRQLADQPQTNICFVFSHLNSLAILDTNICSADKCFQNVSENCFTEIVYF